MIYSQLLYDPARGTCLEFICRACYLASPKRKLGSDYCGPSIRQDPEPGEKCSGCQQPL